MRGASQKDEPDYMIVLDRIYQKDAVVAYPNLPSYLDEFYPNSGATEKNMKIEMILRDLPGDKSLLPLPLMSNYKVLQAINSLIEIGLVEETDQIDGIPLTLIDEHPDHLNYIRLTKTGFEVAHDRGIRQRQQEILEEQSKSSHLLAAVTILLAVTAVIQATVAVFSLSWPLNLVLGVVYGIILSVLLFKHDKLYGLLTQALV